MARQSDDHGVEPPATHVPRLHVLVDTALSTRRAVLESMVERGGRELALQLRDPLAHGRAAWDAAVALGSLNPAPVLLVNDRVDVGLGARAAGIHLKESSLAPEDVRRLVRPGMLLGRSVHSLDAVERWSGRERGPLVDYLVLGSVTPTTTHPGEEALPRATVEEAPSRSGVPLLAIGGVSPTSLGRLCEWGYHGAVVASGVWAAPDPLAALSAYLEILSRHPSAWNLDGDD